ncbi:hypothetical protein ACHAWF_013782 [Thalassiosira exigua]
MSTPGGDSARPPPPRPPPHAPTSGHFRPRYAGPSPEEMTPEQRSLRDAILASRPRTGLAGPFGPWLAVPSVARPSQELGRTVRYGTSLSMRESELVILLTAAKFRSEAEFDIHAGEACRAGLGWDVVRSVPRGTLPSEEAAAGTAAAPRMDAEEFSLDAVRRRVLPVLEAEHDEGRARAEDGGAVRDNAKERESAVASFAAELLDRSAVSDETYAATKQALGGEDAALVEVTAIAGYYAYVAYTLNVFRIAAKVETPSE